MSNPYRHPRSGCPPELIGFSPCSVAAPKQPLTVQQRMIRMIDRLMDEADVDQRELATRMKVSEARVSQMLKTDSNMTLKTVDRILAALSVSLISLGDLDSAAPGRATEWRDLDCAPLDGTPVILLTSDFGAIEGWWEVTVPNFYKSQKGWASYDPDNAQGDWVSEWKVGDGDEHGRLYCGATPKAWMPKPPALQDSTS